MGTIQPLKVLLSAYSCRPDKGSEAGKGWACARAMAGFHEVWVITRRRNRPYIEAVVADDPMPNLHFAYLDAPSWTRPWETDEGFAQLYYYLWQVGAYFVGLRLARRIEFDVVHHITLSKYWAPSFVGLLPIPFVWGPVGGGESAPRSFWREFNVRGKLYEALRDAGRWLGELDPFVRLTARRSTIALATTEESAARMRRLRAPDVRVYPAIGLPQPDIDRLGTMNYPSGTAFRFVCVGRLLHWKGFHLAVKAFARAGLKNAELWVIGDGAQRQRLQALAEELKVADRVTFHGRLRRDQTLEKLSQCHVVVHPSLHDSGGLICLEAMAAGRPVICLDAGGPAAQVSAEAGIKVAARSPQQAAEDLAAAMVRLAGDDALYRAMGAAGRSRVAAHYQWKDKTEHYNTLYHEVIGSQDDPLPLGASTHSGP